MRTGLSTIQQTLTPEAASVLNHSIADAGRRGHSQTTPLHVASTLLSSSNGYLRQACIHSHPNSSHPLQCRALELCFTVALERLPASQSVVSHDPPVSNALLAALKRAQAHQRRGCPEQQQQPLLAVKVELEQLVISILDDPSVSRVMREASFSSPAVKAAIEQTLTATSSNSNSQTSPKSSFGLSSAVSHRHIASRNAYLNPWLQASGTGIAAVDRPNAEQRPEEVKKIVEILSKGKKRNPILVGDHEPEAVMKELMQRIERKEIGEEFRGLHVFSLEKELSGICSGKREEKGEKQSVAMKFRELGELIESKIGGGVILNLGDLKWLVEHGGGAAVSGVVQEVIVEMARLLSSHGREWKLWLIGTATCETYLRCQVYYPSMENDWDLQAVPIAARVRPALFLRNENNGVHSSSDIETVSTLKSFPRSPLSSRRGSENGDSARKMICCPACMDNYEKELGNLVAKEFEISNSDSKPEELQLEPLSQWLRLAKPSAAKPLGDSPLVKDQQEQIFRQKTEELQRKWVDTCTRLHPGFRANIDVHKPVTSPLSSPVMSGGAKAAGFANPRLFRPIHQPIQHKMPLTRSINLQLFPPNLIAANRKSASPPRSPVRTDLVLGRITPEKAVSPVMDVHRERVKESNGCSLPQQFVNPYNHINADVKISCSLDGDSFKRLFKGLTQKVDWQTEAATAVAAAVTKSKSGEGKQRAVGAKGDTWLLFLGPDKVGKKKMALGLSELVFGNKPVCIRLGSSDGCYYPAEDDEERGGVVRGKIVRGKTVLDRIVDAVRRNPFSVVVLEDVDQADSLVQGKLVGAMEKGRLPDSHGREVGLGSVIFIMTANWMPDGLRKPLDTVASKEEKLSSIAASSCRPLQLVVVSRSAKRGRPLWLEEEEAVSCTAKKPSLGIDLNLSAEDNDVVNSGSRNSSDLTFEASPPTLKITPTSSMKNISNAADEAVVFSPVDFEGLSNKVSTKLAADFAAQFSEASFEIQTAALDQIVVGLWFNPSSNRLDDLHSWADRALAPALRELRSVLVGGRETLVRLEVSNGGDVVDEHRPRGNWLPEKITVSRVG